MPPLSVRTPAWFVVSRPSPRPGSSLPRPPRPPRPCACSITVSAASVTEMTRSFLTSLLRLLLEAVLDAELHDAQEDTRNAARDSPWCSAGTNGAYGRSDPTVNR